VLPHVALICVDESEIVLRGAMVEETEVLQLAASEISTVYVPGAKPETSSVVAVELLPLKLL